MAENIQEECKTENGELKCKFFKQNKDGTRITLAEAGKRVDGQCNAITTFIRGDKRYTQELSDMMDKRVVLKCSAKNVPEDY